MLKSLWWALAALSLVACMGGTSSNDQTVGDDDDAVTVPAGTGGINVHATYEDVTEDCQVIIQNQEAGGTDEDIVGLTPGTLEFQLGSLSRVSLDGNPYHITEDNEYLVGQGSANVKADEVSDVSAKLVLAPQHHCYATDCDWPYEGGACNGRVYDDPPQWIAVNPNGELEGSEVMSVVGGVKMTLIDGVFNVTATDNGTEIVDGTATLDLATLKLSFTYIDEAFGVAQQMTCEVM